jgi:hypothetical protein
MRVIVPTLMGLVALAAVSAQAAPNLSKAYPHETPAQNVWKSQQYDHLLRPTHADQFLTNVSVGVTPERAIERTCTSDIAA